MDSKTIEIESYLEFTPLIGRLESGLYTFVDGHIYYNNNCIKIRYDLINNTGMTYKRGYGRFYLMASYTHTARTETYYSRTVKLYDTGGDEDQWNDDHRVVSSFGDQSWLVPSSNAVSMSPLTCVRFETSLKVETKCTLAVAGAPSSYVFAQYVIT